MGIGASAGGLEAFTALLSHLPESPDVAYVLVQHLDPTHRSLLTELLARATSLPVREITEGMTVAGGQIYVIPPNSDLAIEKGVLRLTPRRKNGGPARSIDHFLQSLAEDQGSNAIGVILSGAGSDGAKGLKAIKVAGGMTFAQDERSSKYDSMPRSAIATGSVDFVLPPDKIASEIARSVVQPGKTHLRAAANARVRRSKLSVDNSVGNGPGRKRTAWPAAPEDLNLRKLFMLLRTKSGTDFSLYRPNTIRRRLARRMSLLKINNLESYLRHLRENATEIEALYQDLLINVTSFFRNPAVFETVKKSVFAKLVKGLGRDEALRFWVAGCSTGQEAYSLAIAYSEFAEKSGTTVPVQIFATDVNGSVLEMARTGRYKKNEISGLSAARLQRYFTRENDTFRVQKAIRDMVIFAQQNLLTDPPFTRVDLITCRNLLIYFEPALQQRIIPSFHYALRPGGFLVLGSSESVGQFTNLFSPVRPTHKVYSKKVATGWQRYERPPTPPAMRISPPAGVRTPVQPRPTDVPAVDVLKEADRLTLERYTPPTVLVSEDGDILQFRGNVSRYLELPAGKASFQLFKMAKDGLAFALQKTLMRARAEGKPVREQNVRMGEGREYVNIEIAPVKHSRSRCFLVVFERVQPATRVSALPLKLTGKAGKISADELRRAAELKREYLEAREELNSLREEHETSVEELQASNEEVQSANEELQSLNEELETSNEELESANEELTTLNEELATRNGELRESEQRLREQAQLLELAPVLARSPKDRIIFWNRGMEKLYGFSKEEAIGQTAHLFLNAQFPMPLEKIQAEFNRQGHWDGEVYHRRKDGRVICVATQWVAHYDLMNKPRAILEVSTDITERKQAERALRESEEFNQKVLQTSPDCITVLDLTGRIGFVSPGGLAVLEAPSLGAVANHYWPNLWDAESRSAAENAYRQALTGESTRFQGICTTLRNKSRKWWDVVVAPMLGSEGRPEKILSVMRDVTDQKQEEFSRAARLRLTALRADIGSVVSQAGESRTILQNVAETVVRHSDVVFARIWTVNQVNVLELRATAGAYAHGVAEMEQVRIEDAKISTIFRDQKPYLTNDVANDVQIGNPDWVARHAMVSFAGYPLSYQGKQFGVIAVFARKMLSPDVFEELAMTAEAVALYLARQENEEERARLYRAAMDARNEALAASRAKDEFIAALSHELRTPLNPVLLLASDGAENPELPLKVREDFETIRDNVTLEARLIDDLLDLTRIAHGKLALELHAVDVHDVLRDAISYVANNIDQKQIDLSLNLLATRRRVLADTMRLKQVFWNILINAVKFNPTGGHLTVETRSIESRDEVQISFADTGIGLSATELDSIFAPFIQGVHRAGGLGLGLAISRQLVEKQGGRISATSDGVGKGATFTVTLPLMSESRPRSARSNTVTVLPVAAKPEQTRGSRKREATEPHS